MALEMLLERLESDLEARVASLNVDADEQVARIREAMAEADARVSRRIVDGQRTVEREAIGTDVIAIHRTARRDRLLARERLIDRIFEWAQALATTPAVADRYRAGVAGYTREALRYVGPGTWRLRCSPTLEAAVKVVAGERAVIADSALPLGVCAESEDGTVVVDNTLLARMTRLRSELAIALLEKLRASP